MRADRGAVDARVHRAHHRSAFARAGRPPVDRKACRSAPPRMGGEADVRATILLRHQTAVCTAPKAINLPRDTNAGREASFSKRRYRAETPENQAFAAATKALA